MYICPRCNGPMLSKKAQRCQACYRKDMIERNHRDAPARMAANNPMKDQKTREKVSATLKRIQHKPSVRGGNGKGSTVPQATLAWGLGWMHLEYAIPTGVPRGTGYPTNYKVDIANPKLKIAIEVDGNSHNVLSRKAQDIKKENFLKSRGWTVLRFTNESIMKDLNSCVQTVMSTISRSKSTIPTSQMV